MKIDVNAPVSIRYDAEGVGHVTPHTETRPTSSFLGRVAYPKRLLQGLDDITPEELNDRLNTATPVAVGLRLTNVCNYACVYCGTAAKRGKDNPGTLTLDEYKDVITQAAEVGARTIIFGANGEPLMTMGLPEILRHTASHGLTPIIFSNVSLLGNDVVCKRKHGITGQELLDLLDESGASLIISAESLQRERYDDIMGVKAFDDFQEAIRRIRSSGLARPRTFGSHTLCRLALSAVIMPLNYDERYDLVDFIHSLNGLAILKPPSLHGAAADNKTRMFSTSRVREIAPELKDLCDKSATLQILNLACASWTLSFSIDNEGKFMACMTEEVNPFGVSATVRNTRLSTLVARRNELVKLGNTICPVKDKFYGENFAHGGGLAAQAGALGPLSGQQ